ARSAATPPTLSTTAPATRARPRASPAPPPESRAKDAKDFKASCIFVRFGVAAFLIERLGDPWRTLREIFFLKYSRSRTRAALGDRQHLLDQHAIERLRLLEGRIVRRLLEPHEALARRFDLVEVRVRHDRRHLPIVAAEEEEDRHLEREVR